MTEVENSGLIRPVGMFVLSYSRQDCHKLGHPVIGQDLKSHAHDREVDAICVFCAAF